MSLHLMPDHGVGKLKIKLLVIITGHLETMAGFVQVGVDSVNKYMMYGPGDKSVTMGLNNAEFRIKIDNNTLIMIR